MDCLYTFIGTLEHALFQNELCQLFYPPSPEAPVHSSSSWLSIILLVLHWTVSPYFSCTGELWSGPNTMDMSHQCWVQQKDHLPGSKELPNAAPDLFVARGHCLLMASLATGKLPVFQHGDPHHGVPWSCSPLVQNLHLLFLKFMGILSSFLQCE